MGPVCNRSRLNMYLAHFIPTFAYLLYDAVDLVRKSCVVGAIYFRVAFVVASIGKRAIYFYSDSTNFILCLFQFGAHLTTVLLLPRLHTSRWRHSMLSSASLPTSRYNVW